MWMYIYLYLFMAMLGLCCCTWAFSSCEWASHSGGFCCWRAWALEQMGFSSCGAQV